MRGRWWAAGSRSGTSSRLGKMSRRGRHTPTPAPSAGGTEALASFLFVEFPQELVHVAPRHLLDWEQGQVGIRNAGYFGRAIAASREHAVVVAHDRLPLPLRHWIDRQRERRLD